MKLKFKMICIIHFDVIFHNIQRLFAYQYVQFKKKKIPR